MTKGQTMDTTKWVLIKRSDGQRGQSGKKKVYEITICGLELRCEWGMAEKPHRQSSLSKFHTPGGVRQAAYVKLYDKLERGYEIAYKA